MSIANNAEEYHALEERLRQEYQDKRRAAAEAEYRERRERIAVQVLTRDWIEWAILEANTDTAHPRMDYDRAFLVAERILAASKARPIPEGAIE